MEKANTKDVTLKLNIEGLDEALEKANRFVETLHEAQSIADSLFYGDLAVKSSDFKESCCSQKTFDETKFDINVDVDANIQMLMNEGLLSKVLDKIKDETKGIPHVNVYFHIS